MTTYPTSICITCKHFIIKKGPLSCKAFPDGILEDILGDLNYHKKPYPADKGIQYEPRE